MSTKSLSAKSGTVQNCFFFTKRFATRRQALDFHAVEFLRNFGLQEIALLVRPFTNSDITELVIPVPIKGAERFIRRNRFFLLERGFTLLRGNLDTLRSQSAEFSHANTLQGYSCRFCGSPAHATWDCDSVTPFIHPVTV